MALKLYKFKEGERVRIITLDGLIKDEKRLLMAYDDIKDALICKEFFMRYGGRSGVLKSSGGSCKILFEDGDHCRVHHPCLLCKCSKIKLDDKLFEM